MSLNPKLIFSGYWLLTEETLNHSFITFQFFHSIPSSSPFLHLYHWLKCLLSSKHVWDLWNSCREPGRYWTLESCWFFFKVERVGKIYSVAHLVGHSKLKLLFLFSRDIKYAAFDIKKGPIVLLSIEPALWIVFPVEAVIHPHSLSWSTLGPTAVLKGTLTEVVGAVQSEAEEQIIHKPALLEPDSCSTKMLYFDITKPNGHFPALV